ncbi:AtpZ/AtpI family protein [bacterium]|jgi:hypothetical protein|nr:AtpZ/AtpI family protein [bacterium]
MKNKLNNEYNKLALTAFAEMTGWIAFPVIAALYLGRWLDQKQDTGSLYFLSLTALAFIISCVGIGLVGAKHLKVINKKDNKQTERSSSNTDDDKLEGKTK